MTVKEILTDVAYLLDDAKLINAISTDTFNGNLVNDKNLLVKCVNFVNNIIATEHFPLIATAELTTITHNISYSRISDKTIFDVINVKDGFGYSVPFKLTSDGIETAKGNLKITYCYLPEDVEYTSTISAYPLKINSRIFAYAVASEYMFIKGNFDEGEIWENRFKNAIQSIQHPRRNVVMPKRRWK